MALYRMAELLKDNGEVCRTLCRIYKIERKVHKSCQILIIKMSSKFISYKNNIFFLKKHKIE